MFSVLRRTSSATRWTKDAIQINPITSVWTKYSKFSVINNQSPCINNNLKLWNRNPPPAKKSKSPQHNTPNHTHSSLMGIRGRPMAVRIDPCRIGRRIRLGRDLGRGGRLIRCLCKIIWSHGQKLRISNPCWQTRLGRRTTNPTRTTSWNWSVKKVVSTSHHHSR